MQNPASLSATQGMSNRNFFSPIKQLHNQRATAALFRHTQDGKKKKPNPSSNKEKKKVFAEEKKEISYS
jgi:hypothetical protein